MITVQISENTPYEALQATSVFIKQLASIFHPGVEQMANLQPTLPLTSPVLQNPFAPAVEKVADSVTAFMSAVSDDDGETDTSAAFQPAPAAPIAVPPAAPAAVAPAVIPVGEVDSAGMPWDGRIHASTKTKIKDGTWKAKKGVDANVVKQVEAELKNRLAGASVPAVAPQAITAAVPGVPAAPTLHVPVAAVPAVPAVPAAPVAASGRARSFSELSALVAAVLTADPTKVAAINQCCQAQGFQNLPVMQNAEPDAIGRVYDAVSLLQPKA